MGADPQLLLELAEQRGEEMRAEVERDRLGRKLRAKRTRWPRPRR